MNSTYLNLLQKKGLKVSNTEDPNENLFRHAP